MNITINSAFLPHTDRDAAVDFYCGKLGFTLLNDVGYDGLHWLTLGSPDQPGVSLVLTPPVADPGVTDSERTVIAEMMAKGTFAIASLNTPDLDATFETLQAADVDIVQEPIEQPWGVRDCAVRDPFGTMVRINEIKA